MHSADSANLMKPGTRYQVTFEQLPQETEKDAMLQKGHPSETKCVLRARSVVY